MFQTLRTRIAAGLVLVALPLTAAAETTGTATSASDGATTSGAYPNICVVSGEKLGSMGEPYSIQHNGRTVKFCCKGCEDEFKKDPDKYLKKLDENISAEQGKNYPTNVCVVSGKDIPAGGGKEIVVNNQLVKICCGGCEAQVRADPDKYLNKLQEQRGKQQAQ